METGQSHILLIAEEIHVCVNQHVKIQETMSELDCAPKAKDRSSAWLKGELSGLWLEAKKCQKDTIAIDFGFYDSQNQLPSLLLLAETPQTVE